jgi:hypothetical protein
MDTSGLFATSIFLQIRYLVIYPQEENFILLKSQLNKLSEKISINSGHMEILQSICKKTELLAKIFFVAYFNTTVSIFMKCAFASMAQSSLQFLVPVL